MPSKNSVKLYLDQTFYHVYNRGVNRQTVFRNVEDYKVFLNLIKRYLDFEVVKDRYDRPYDKLHDVVELSAYCLMPNHFHFLIYNVKAQGLPAFMQRICTAYGVYFNNKYNRVGPVFQGRYKAVSILEEGYLWHISRYIHLNPLDISANYTSYDFSSFADYVGRRSTAWTKPKRILSMFKEGRVDYETFLRDFQSYRRDLKDLKPYLGDA